MSSHKNVDNDNDDHHNTSKRISDLELGVIKGGEEENNDNIKKNYQSNIPTELKHRDSLNTNDTKIQQKQGLTSVTCQVIHESDGPILELMKSKEHQSNIPTESTRGDHSNTINAKKQQQQDSTSVTCQLIHESHGPILEMTKSQQRHPNTAPPLMAIKKIESVNELSEDEDETDINNVQITLRPGAERVYPTGVPSSTTHIDNYNSNINFPGSSCITSEQQEQQEPMEIVATLVTNDSQRMIPPNINNGPLIFAVAKDKKYIEINMNRLKCFKNVKLVGLMMAIALIVVAVVVLMNKTGSGGDDMALTFAPTLTEVPTPAPTEAPTLAPTEAPTLALTKAPTSAPTETLTPTRFPFEPIHDLNKETAIELWFRDKQAAENKYGSISIWDTSRVTIFALFFERKRDFNEDISKWDVSRVTDMSWMFFQATAFNQDISGWDVSRVKHMNLMFYDTAFNEDISKWDVSRVTDMSGMFAEATAFNQDISQWDVSRVTSMSVMFHLATAFNQDISQWDVSRVTSMDGMFAATAFNQDISQWDVSRVQSMNGMFYNATAFNQMLCWNIDHVKHRDKMFYGSPGSIGCN